jgi:DNA-binding GntR family transcriptional regulator
LRPMLVVLDRSPGCDFESMIAEHELLLEDLLAGDIQPASERLIRHLNETEKRLQIMLLMKHVPPRQRHSR